jgi:hypothetical protein
LRNKPNNEYEPNPPTIIPGFNTKSSAIELDQHDIQISIHGLITALLPRMLPANTLSAFFAARGGKSTSPAKRQSAQQNGHPGGRPRKSS